MKRYLVPSFLIIICSLFIANKAMQAPQYLMYTLPNLPAPIGKENVLVTSAGQDSDGVIVQEIMKELHISADYRPTALATDLYDYHTVMIVVGFSPNGLNSTIRSYDEEKLRIKEICKEAQRRKLPIILVHLGGSERLDKKSMEFINMAAPYARYLIGLRTADYSGKLRSLANNNGFSITLVKRIQDMKIPINSVFR